MKMYVVVYKGRDGSKHEMPVPANRFVEAVTSCQKTVEHDTGYCPTVVAVKEVIA